MSIALSRRCVAPVLASWILLGCDYAEDVGSLPAPETTPPGGSAAFTPSKLDLADLGGDPIQLDAALAGDRFGVAITYVKSGGVTGVAFFAVGLDGARKSPLVRIGEGRVNIDAGAAIAWDRALGRFAVIWAEEGASPPVLTLEALGPDGTRIASGRGAVPDAAWLAARALDVAVAEPGILAVGTLAGAGRSAPFVMTFDESTAAFTGSFDTEDFASERSFVARVGCEVDGGSRCMLVVRDEAAPREDAFGLGLGAVRTVDPNTGEVTGTEVRIGSGPSAHEGGARQKAVTEGGSVISVGILDSGALRVQSARRECATSNPFQGCVDPSIRLTRDDLAASALGVPEAARALIAPAAIALAVASADAVVALAEPGNTGHLVFAAVPAPALEAAGAHVRLEARVHQRVAPLRGEPQLVLGSDAWHALWLEGSDLMLGRLR